MPDIYYGDVDNLKGGRSKLYVTFTVVNCFLDQFEQMIFSHSSFFVIDDIPQVELYQIFKVRCTNWSRKIMMSTHRMYLKTCEVVGCPVNQYVMLSQVSMVSVYGKSTEE